MPNILAIFLASDLASPTKAIAYLLVVMAGMFLPLIFFRARTYFIVMGIIYLPCAPIEIASLYINHNPATATFVGLFYFTNCREVLGIIDAFWPFMVLLVIIWIVYFILAIHQPQKRILSRKVCLLFVGVVFPLITSIGFIFFGRYANNLYNIHEPREVLMLSKDLALMKFYKIFPYNIYLNSYDVLSNRHEAHQAQSSLASFRFGINESTDSIPELYVLVIGEAARSENFSINGYNRVTTPRLEQRCNLVSYQNMYSQAGTTEQSVPHMISRIPISRHCDIYKEKTLPEAFQERGFKSIWLTNKSRAFYMERILEAMDNRFETGKDMSTKNNYDEYLLEPLQKNLYDDSPKHFIVIHTMGSHWRYDTRHPTAFNVFTPSIGQDFQLNMISPDNRQLLLNSYDNTILYTDYFLDSLISIIEHKKIPSVIIYMSDHGENLYDDERQLVLHGNYSASQWLFHVPFIVWYSAEYAMLYPEKIKQLRKHASCRDNSSVIFSSLLDAANVEDTNKETNKYIYPIERSIFSEQYTAPDTIFVLTAEGNIIELTE